MYFIKFQLAWQPKILFNTSQTQILFNHFLVSCISEGYNETESAIMYQGGITCRFSQIKLYSIL